MSAEDTITPTFYSVWPNLGKKFAKQLGEIRTDTSSLTPVVRGIGLDADGDFSSLDGVAANSVQAYEIGEQDWHNKFRIHYNKTTDVFEIASNTGTTLVPQWYTFWWVDRDGHVTQQNTPTTASNVGGGAGVFKQKVGVDLEFKSLTATSPITLTENDSTIDVDGSALVSTYSSDQAAAPSGDAGVGVEIVLSDTGKVGNDLPFKAIKAGPNIVVSNTGTAIQIESTAQVVEFYGIAVGHDDGSQNYPEVHNFLVNRQQFYVTQQKSNPSAKTIILNSISEPFVSADFVAVVGDDMIGPLAQADGSAALPSYTFTDDVTMGLFRNAADDLGVAIAGAAHTRFLSDRLFIGHGLQVTNTGSAAAPDIYFFPDSDTGLYQENADELAFATGGARAGWFDANQDLHVQNDLHAGRVTTQYGLFYGSAIAQNFFARDASSGVSRPGYAFTNDEHASGTTSGMYLAAASLQFGYAGGTILFLNGTSANLTKPLYAVDGASNAPAYAFTNNTDMGMYRRGEDSLGFSNQQGIALHIASTAVDSEDRIVVATKSFSTGGTGDTVNPGYGFNDLPNAGFSMHTAAPNDAVGLYIEGAYNTWWQGTSQNTTGGVFTRSGSVSSLGHSFRDDTNTGMYQISAGDGSVAFSCDGVAAGRFVSNSGSPDLYVTNDIFAGGGVITFKESQSGGASFFSNSVSFDSSRFYVSSGGDGKPLVSLSGSVITEDTHEGINNLAHLNDGGLGDDEAIGMTVASDGATITLTITNTGEGKSATDPFEVQFEGQNYTFTPSGGAETLTLTAGTATVPVENFVVFELVGGVVSLVTSTTDWPSDAAGEHHGRVCTIVVQDATSVQTHGVLKIHAWTDHIEEIHGAGSGERGERGHLHSIAERLRNEPAVWRSGSSITVDNSGSTNPLYVHIASGTGYQMHRHNSPALDTDGSDLIFVVNDDTTPYTTIDSLDDLTRYATAGEGAIGNSAKFTVVLWMVVNENSGDTKLFLNLPTGGYNTVNAAKTDSDNKRVYDVPQAYVGTSLLLYELVLGRSGGGSTWTVEDTVDLRGVPGVHIGGGGAATTGEVNTGSNVGAGEGVFAQKTNEVLEFKSFQPLNETIAFTNDADEIFVEATGLFPDNIRVINDVRAGNVETGFAHFYIGVKDSVKLLVAPSQGGKFVGHSDALIPLLTIAEDPTTGIGIWDTGAQGGVQIWHNDFVILSAADNWLEAFRPLRIVQASTSSDPAIYANKATKDPGVYTTLDSGFFGWGWTLDGDEVGYWNQPDHNLYVNNDVRAGRVEAGHGSFYTSVHVDGDITIGNVDPDFGSTNQFQILAGGNDFIPGYSFRGSEDSGFAYSGNGNISVLGEGALVCIFDPDSFEIYTQTRLHINSTSSNPSLVWRDNIDTGVYQHMDDSILGPEGWGWTINGTDVGYWHPDDLDLHILNNAHVGLDVKAGRVEAGIGSFYTSLDVDGTITTTVLTATGDITGNTITADSEFVSGTLSFSDGAILDSDGSITFAGTDLTNIGTLNLNNTKVIQFNDANTVIGEDGSSNLYFTDAVTGTKTLAELAAGDVSKVGTPVDNEIGVWTGDGTLEGDTNFQWDASTLTVAGRVSQRTDTTNVAYGYQAGVATNASVRGTFIGYEAGLAVTTAVDNLYIGYQAGKTNTTAGQRNIAIGPFAGTAATSADDSVYIGYNAGKAQTSNDDNTFVGASAGEVSTGRSNTYIGKDAGKGTSSGIQNVFIGQSAGSGANSTVSTTVLIGYLAGLSLGTGTPSNPTGNIFIGNEAGRRTTTGVNNTFIGASAGEDNIDGGGNVCIGGGAGKTLTNADDNMFLGKDAGLVNLSSDNMFLGGSSGKANTSGTMNLFVGRSSGILNVSGSRNIYLGFAAAGRQDTADDQLIIDNRLRASKAAELTDSIIVGVMAAAPANQKLLFNADVVSSTYNYAADSGAADVYVMTMDPIPNGYREGMQITFKASAANTGACTVNVNSLGAKDLKLGVSTDPGANYIKLDSIVTAVYDGTNFQMIQPAAQ